MAYNVKLDIFEGPLDLLLYLIKKSEVDIYDIPIAVITEEYLKYLDVMKSLNLDVAGEFILMAATLIHIKSKMLLPIDEETEEEEEGVDPRAALIQKLIELQRFKFAAEELYSRTMLGRDVFKRGSPHDGPDFEEETIEIGDVSMFELLEAFRAILKRAPKPYSIDITVDKFRVKDKINQIMEMLNEKSSLTFNDLFPLTAARGEMIVTFLAVLELARLFMIKVNQTEDGVIRLYAPKIHPIQRSSDALKEPL